MVVRFFDIVYSLIDPIDFKIGEVYSIHSSYFDDPPSLWQSMYVGTFVKENKGSVVFNNIYKLNLITGTKSFSNPNSLIAFSIDDWSYYIPRDYSFLFNNARSQIK